jgi:Tol biopolymer transport system component
MRRIVLLLVSTAAALVLAGGVGLLNAAKPAEATFLGVNGKIVYVASDGNDQEIYTINPTGGAPFKLTNNTKDDDTPSYSPNGKRIAYSSYDENDHEIYTINAGGGAAFNVTNNDRSDYSPDYSPDGKKIAYTGYEGLGTDDDEDFDHEIYTINVSGGSKSQVTNTKYWASNPAWGSRP